MIRETAQIKSITDKIKQEHPAQQAILFGSYARGQTSEDSDVDLLVIAPTSERFFQRMATDLRIVRDLRRGIPLSPIILRADEIKSRLKIGDQFIKEIMENGIRL